MLDSGETLMLCWRVRCTVVRRGMWGQVTELLASGLVTVDSADAAGNTVLIIAAQVPCSLQATSRPTASHRHPG
jgi:hypothetical protein